VTLREDEDHKGVYFLNIHESAKDPETITGMTLSKFIEIFDEFVDDVSDLHDPRLDKAFDQMFAKWVTYLNRHGVKE
jgi:hypothetical protein